VAAPQPRLNPTYYPFFLEMLSMKLLNSLTGAAALVLALAAAPAFAVDVGQAAPDIELPGATGAQKLSDLKGKVVYLDFWASWCGPCRQSFPWMNDMQKKYGAKGLQVVGVNLDAKRSDADKFLAETPAQFALAFDTKGESPKKVGVKGMPTSVLIGADGKVLAVHQGFKDEERGELEAKLVAALGSVK
jgi:cytochrome c biogenesis protein CcmG, thiol:disulfide interchange protein DsbE